MDRKKLVGRKPSPGYLNKDELKRAKEVGCYACLRTFPFSEITQWEDNGQTGFCPYCWVDALIGRLANESLTAFSLRLKKLQEKMKAKS